VIGVGDLFCVISNHFKTDISVIDQGNGHEHPANVCKKGVIFKNDIARHERFPTKTGRMIKTQDDEDNKHHQQESTHYNLDVASLGNATNVHQPH